MLIKSGEHSHLAHLLTFMVLGEQLAHDCAQAQVSLTPERGIQTFLAGQSRQEGYHALAFQGAIRWLTPHAKHPSPMSEHMNTYRGLLEAALARKDFAETLLAEQIILEGLGEAILKRMEVGLVKRGAPFRKLRRMLIHQEEAHHQFGLRILAKMLERDEESYETLRDRTRAYMPLAHTLLFSAQEAFYSINEDPQDYWDDFLQNLPAWLHTPSSHSMQWRSPSLSMMSRLE